jgi:hypothetical protein
MFDRFLTLGWRTLSHFIKYVSRNLDRTPKSVRSATSTRRLIQKLEFSLLRVVFLERIVLLDPAAYAKEDGGGHDRVIRRLSRPMAIIGEIYERSA